MSRGHDVNYNVAESSPRPVVASATTTTTNTSSTSSPLSSSSLPSLAAGGSEAPSRNSDDASYPSPSSTRARVFPSAAFEDDGDRSDESTTALASSLDRSSSSSLVRSESPLVRINGLLGVDGDEDDDENDDGENVASSRVLRGEATLLDEERSTKRAHEGGQSTVLWALVNFVKSYIGSGVLGLPYAFLIGGILPSVFAMLLVSLLSNYCIQLLVKSRTALAKRNGSCKTYGHVGEQCYGAPGKIVVDVLLMLTQLGFCTAYLVFISTTLEALVPAIAGVAWIAITALVLACVALIRSLKWLAPFSLAGEVTIIGGLSIVVVYALTHQSEGVINVARIEWLRFPLFFGIACYAFEGIGLAIPIETSMKKPEHFTKRVLHIGYAFITTLFLFFGFTCYIAFREETNENLSKNVVGPVFPILISVSLVLALFFTYPLQLFPVIEIVELMVLKPEMRFYTAGRTAVRIGIVLATAIVAWLVGEHFALLMSIIGGVGSASLMFVLPSLFYYKTFEEDLSKFQKGTSIALIVFGLCISLMTVVATIYDLANPLVDEQIAPTPVASLDHQPSVPSEITTTIQSAAA